jgi:hypothetical protein
MLGAMDADDLALSYVRAMQEVLTASNDEVVIVASFYFRDGGGDIGGDWCFRLCAMQMRS